MEPNFKKLKEFFWITNQKILTASNFFTSAIDREFQMHQSFPNFYYILDSSRIYLIPMLRCMVSPSHLQHVQPMALLHKSVQPLHLLIHLHVTTAFAQHPLLQHSNIACPWHLYTCSCIMSLHNCRAPCLQPDVHDSSCPWCPTQWPHPNIWSSASKSANLS